MKRQGLGATGRFPQGKIHASDEGELRIAVGHYEGNVVLDFGKPTSWIGFPNDAIHHDHRGAVDSLDVGSVPLGVEYGVDDTHTHQPWADVDLFLCCWGFALELVRIVLTWR